MMRCGFGLPAVVLTAVVATVLVACGGSDDGLPQPPPGLDALEPAWVAGHAACTADADEVPIRWVTSDYHDTDIVGYGGERAGWSNGELCVRGRILWDYGLGSKAGVTIRAQGQPIEGPFDYRQWLEKDKPAPRQWQKFVVAVLDLPERPSEVKLAVKLYFE